MTPPTNNSSAGLSNNLHHHQQQPVEVPVSGHKMKHTGRVHVRGLFRRVWRPRFLELNTDLGVLRYFEASTSSSPRKGIYNNNNEGGGDGALSREMQAFSLPPSFLCSPNDDGMISNSNNNNNRNNNNKYNINKSDNLYNDDTAHESIDAKAHADNDNDNQTQTIKELTNIDDDSISKPFPSTPSKDPLDKSLHSENDNSKAKIITSKKYQDDTASQNSSINDNDYLNILNTSHDSTNVARNESWHHITSDTNQSTKLKQQESGNEEFIMNDYLQPPQISSQTTSLSSHNQIHNTTTTTDTAIQAELPHRYHQHRPKAVLIILSARMIDIRQLRDMHIGLPKGKFGFIFRGRPCDMSLLMTNNHSHNNNHHFYNSYDDLCNPLSILSATEHEFFSSSRDYFCFVDTYDEAQSWVTVLQSAASVTLSKIRFQQRKNYGLVFDEEDETDEYNQQHGRGYYYNEYRRDDDTHDVIDDGYHTDETSSSYYHNLFISPSSNNHHHVNKDKQHKIHFHKKQSWLSSATAARRKQSLFEDMSSCESSSSVYLGDSNYDHLSHNESILDDTITSNQCNDDTTTTNEPFIIITKVKSFELNNIKRKRLIRLQMDVLYNVQMLLLNKNHFNTRKEKHCKSSSSPSSRQNECNDICYNNDTIEERTLLRSWDQFTYLIDCMIDELQNQVPSRVDIIDEREQLSSDGTKQVKDGMTVLQNVKSKLSNIKIENENRWIMSPCRTYDTYCQNVATIDEVLRAVSSHGQLCNLSILKEFLSLQQNMQQSNTQTNYNPQNKSSFHQIAGEYHPIKCSKFLNIKVGESTDDFVRDWLFGQVSNNNATNLNTKSIEWVKICLLLSLRQNSWIELPLSLGIIYVMRKGVHASMMFSSYSHFYSWLIPIRLDMLCIMTITIFYIGFQLGLRSNNRKENQVSKVSSKPHNKEKGESTKRLSKATTKRKRIIKNKSHQNNNDERYHHGLEDDLILSNTTSYDSDYEKSPTMDNSIDDDDDGSTIDGTIPSQLPKYSSHNGTSCWSTPDDSIFKVRGKTYLHDRIKIPSNPSPFTCRGVEVWLTENAERHIARYPYVLNGRLGEEDTFVVNFLLPFANFVAYFTIPPDMMLQQSRLNPNNNNNNDDGGGSFSKKCSPITATKDNNNNNTSLTTATPLNRVWNKFINGDQAYRDARLKLLPIVMDGPWIVKKAVGPGTSPALLGQAIPLQYYFTHPTSSNSRNPKTKEKKGVYEVDIIITASKIAKGILNVVKGHTKKLSIAFAFILEGSEDLELPETVLCSFQVHSLHLENCPHLPEYTLAEDNDNDGDDDCMEDGGSLED